MMMRFRCRLTFRCSAASAKRRVSTVLVSALLLLTTALSAFAANDLDFTALRYLVVLQDARKKPLDSAATEMWERITGKRTFVDPETGQRREALDVWVSMWLQTRDWSKVPVILLTYQPLKAKLGLPADQKYFSYEQLATPKFQAMIDPILQKAQREEEKQGNLTRDEREARTVFERLNALASASGLGSVAVAAPPLGSQKREWVSIDKVGTYYGEEKQAEMTGLMQGLTQAYMQRDPAAFSAASRALVTGLRNLNPSAYPSIEALHREIHYNSLHAFGKAWMLYLLAFVWLLVTWRSRSAAVYWFGIAAFVAGVAVHAYGFYLRIMISGRPPVTNMYESVVWVSFGAAVFALILELIYRQRYYVVAVAPISILMLLLADQFPAVLDPSIGPLTPVLRSNYWLSIHVPTITLGYAAFAVALGVGHVALAYHIWAPGSPRLARLEHYVYRAMQIGVLFLAAGTILGGIWANEAWGRFWGWDPKGNVGADCVVELSDSVARQAGRLDGQFRVVHLQCGLFHGGVDGVVRGEFCAGQGPAQLRIRHRRLWLCHGLCRSRTGVLRLRNATPQADAIDESRSVSSSGRGPVRADLAREPKYWGTGALGLRS